MYTAELLDPARIKIWQKLKQFNRRGVLGGGTAIALQIGHRRSYDFDIFIDKKISKSLTRLVLDTFGQDGFQKVFETDDDYTIITNSEVKITFFYFPFPPVYPLVKGESLPLFNLIDLASNKAYLLGRRPAYRDYFDLYFLLKKHITLSQLITETQTRFGGGFSDRLFLEQLGYFEDLKDFSIDYLTSDQPTVEDVKSYFVKITQDYVG